jgi:DNA polymerase elongation subunit (family B)
VKRLLLDIETSPNLAHIWGLRDQYINPQNLLESSYVLCWAAKWHGEDEVQFDSVNKSSHKTMLRRIHRLISAADAVIHYNGTRFDMPTLNKEFLLHGFPPPAPYKQIDLLKTVRQQFRFPSNKLDYVAQRLGLGKKTDHEGYTLWVKCMNKDKEAWKRMEEYNIQDVVLLEKVYAKVLPWIKNHPNRGLFDGSGCPTCGSGRLQKRGFSHSSTGTYQRFQCTECGSWSRSTKAVKESVKIVNAAT